MGYTPTQWHAACHIQRIFRGAHFRATTLPILRKYQPSNVIRQRFTQQSSHYYNTLDAFWASPIEGTSPAAAQGKGVEFFPTRIARFENDDVALEEFEILDGCDTIGGAFAQIINASVENRPIYRYITPENAEGLKEYFDQAIEKISAGKSVRVWDGKSTQIHPHSRSILDKAYDGFLYFAGYPPVPGRTEYTEEMDAIEELEERIRQLSSLPVGPCTVTPEPTLVRQGSTRIGGVAVDLSKMKPKDDLEERFERLLALNK